MSRTATDSEVALSTWPCSAKHLLQAVGDTVALRSSMLTAIERLPARGRDFLNGRCGHRGAVLGIPTPINSAIHSVFEIARGEARPARPHAALLRAHSCALAGAAADAPRNGGDALRRSRLPEPALPSSSVPGPCCSPVHRESAPYIDAQAEQMPLVQILPVPDGTSGGGAHSGAHPDDGDDYPSPRNPDETLSQ
jgi:hypothetical protein